MDDLCFKEVVLVLMGMMELSNVWICGGGRGEK